MPSSSEIRQQFIDFFCKKHGHQFVPSSPVVPHDDPTNGIPRDDEAAGHWRAVGVPESQIHLGNKKDNFWEMGNTGPCGPCTEVHIDRTPDKSGGKLVNAGTDKVIEIWNLVFIQFNRNEDQSL